MENLIKLMKLLEIELRANQGDIVAKELWKKLTELSDWNYRIIQDFILRVRMAIKGGDYNFVFKLFESEFLKQNKSFFNNPVDIVIAILKRDKEDVALTDAWNRLLVPSGLQSKVIEIWGYQVTKARNIAVEQALKHQAKYLLFIDDDIIAPNNALIKLYNLMKKKKCLVTSGLYYKKISSLEAPFENTKGQINISEKRPIQKASKLCGMGFCLIDVEQVTEKVPLPLFWEFGAPDGFWSMGEDAFFTQNLLEYTKSIPLVDTSIKCLHVDKQWKKFFGERDKDAVYASNIVDNLESFNRMRVPPKYPFILICIPTRNENDPVAVDLDNLLLYRGYRSELFRVWGLNVDEARNVCAEEALKRGADYLLFIDDDIIPPKDGLNKLLGVVENLDAEVVSGNYYLKGKDGLSAHTQLNDDGVVTSISRIKNLEDVFISNWLIGLGFCIINTNIFKQARKPWFQCYSKNKDQKDINEDAHFCELCLDNGYKIYVNKDVECLHVDFIKQTIFGIMNTAIEYSTYSHLLNNFSLINFEGAS